VSINRKNPKFIIILFLLAFFKLSFPLSISPGQSLASHIEYNKYYLFNIKEGKLVTFKRLSDIYDGAFPISSSKIALTQNKKILISDNIIIKPEIEYQLQEPIKDIIPLVEKDNQISFIALTSYSINYITYLQNQIKLITKKELIRYYDSKKYDNKIIVANNISISVFTISNFLWFINLNEKKITLKDVILSSDFGSNKYVTLKYISSNQRKVTFHTLNNMEIKSIDLQGNYRKIFLDFQEKEAILFDQSDSLKILSINGSLRESYRFPSIILDIQKFKDGFILVIENNEQIEFVKLNKDFNKT